MHLYALYDRIVEGVGRKGAGAVPGVDARFLDMLHDPCNYTFFAVRYRVHVDLDGVFEEFVYKDRPFGRCLSGLHHKRFEVIFGIDDLHGPSPEHIGRANYDRVTDDIGHFPCLLKGDGNAVFGLGQIQSFEQRLELVPVFSQIYALGGGADDRGPRFLQGCRQIEGGLPPELDDDACGLFPFRNVEDILQGEGLEVEFVGSVVVRAYRLRVTVHHYGLVTQVLKGKGRMDATIIKLYPLSDPVRPPPRIIIFFLSDSLDSSSVS